MALDSSGICFPDFSESTFWILYFPGFAMSTTDHHASSSTDIDSTSREIKIASSTAVALLTRAVGLLQSKPSIAESEALDHIQKAIKLLTDNMEVDLVSFIYETVKQNYKSDYFSFNRMGQNNVTICQTKCLARFCQTSKLLT